MDQTEAELESFRQQWREEVSAKARGQVASATAPQQSQQPTASSSRPTGRRKSIPPPPSSSVPATGKQKARNDDWEGYQPRSYHDIDERETGIRLGDAGTAAASTKKEPKSALEHYEEAVKKETIGNLGDSISLYRKAFRLDARVHEAYKNKHFPPSSFKPTTKPTEPKPHQNATPVAVPAVPAPPAAPAAPASSGTAPHAPLTGLSKGLSSLIEEFSQLTIQGEPPPTDLSPAPPCPISSLPEELLVEILIYLAIQDVSSLGRLVQVCKRLAYLVLTEDRIWKRVALGCEYGFAAMHYSWACNLFGKPLGDDGEGGRILSSAAFPPKEPLDEDDEEAAKKDTSVYRLYNRPVQSTTTLVPSPYPSHLSLFRTRPRIRFGGVYISTVNYTRPGASSPNQVSWNSPVLIVTYYRYLRFFRDGSVISLLTTAEPADVVAHMVPENLRQDRHSSLLPNSVMKDALPGRWRLSGPADKAHPTSIARAEAAAAAAEARDEATQDGDENNTIEASGAVDGTTTPVEEDEDEEEGILHVETEGAVPKYMYRMALTVGSAGRGAKSNKLSWKGYWYYNKLTDDWAEFGLKNDRPFYWSRVKRFSST